MRTAALCLMLLAAGLLSGGCATANGVKTAEQARKAYESFIGQRRTYEAFAIEGSNVTFSITGANRIVMQAPHEPLHAMPQDPDTAMRLFDAAKNTILGGLGIYTMGKIATQGPTIVQQPDPVIVSPEVVQAQVVQPQVVQVPAAAAGASP